LTRTAWIWIRLFKLLHQCREPEVVLYTRSAHDKGEDLLVWENNAFFLVWFCVTMGWIRWVRWYQGPEDPGRKFPIRQRADHGVLLSCEHSTRQFSYTLSTEFIFTFFYYFYGASRSKPRMGFNFIIENYDLYLTSYLT
jgi:hypothetical protein